MLDRGLLLASSKNCVITAQIDGALADLLYAVKKTLKGVDAKELKTK